MHGPMIWNSLPDDLRAQQDYESFRQGLKTWLFSRYYRVQRIRHYRDNKVKGKVFPYSLPSVGPGADPGVQAVSPQVTRSESRHHPAVA